MKKILLMIALVFLLVSCDSPKDIEDIKIIGENEYFIKDTPVFEVEIKPADANKEVIWSTSDSTIATIDEDGKATFLKTGNCTIIATSKENETKIGTLAITIKETIIKVSEVKVIGETEYFVDDTPVF